MFSAVEIAWFSIVPAAIAAIITWLANRRWSKASGDLAVQADGPVRPVRMVGAAIAVSVSIAIFAIQMQDHHNVLALTGEAELTSETQRSLWSKAFLKTNQNFASPRVAHHWSLAIAVGGLMTGGIVAWRRAKFLRLFVAIAASGTVILRLLWTSVYLRSEWTFVEQVAWIGGASLLAGWAWWMAANRIEDSNIPEQGDAAKRGSHAHQRLFLIGGTIGLIAATLLLTGSLRYGVVAAVIASATGGAWIASWKRKRDGMRGEWCGPLVMLTTFLLVIGTAFSELPIPQALLFAASLMFALVASSCSGDSPLWKTSGWIAIGILPAIIATVWAIIIFADTLTNAPVNPYDAYK